MLFSLENLRPLAGLYGNLGKTWSQHGPNMVPKNRHSIEMVLRPFGFSVGNFSALACLEVMLGKTGSQHGPEK